MSVTPALMAKQILLRSRPFLSNRPLRPAPATHFNGRFSKEKPYQPHWLSATKQLDSFSFSSAPPAHRQLPAATPLHPKSPAWSLPQKLWSFFSHREPEEFSYFKYLEQHPQQYQDIEELYDALTLRHDFRPQVLDGKSIADIFKAHQPTPHESQLLKRVQNQLIEQFKTYQNQPGIIKERAYQEGEHFVGYMINRGDGAYPDRLHQPFIYKNYLRVQDPQNILPEQVEALNQALCKLGFNGHLKIRTPFLNLHFSSDQFVFHFLHPQEAKKVEAAIHQVFGERVQKIGRGLDDDTHEKSWNSLRSSLVRYKQHGKVMKLPFPIQPEMTRFLPELKKMGQDGYYEAPSAKELFKL